jgi:hypothetical protein
MVNHTVRRWARLGLLALLFASGCRSKIPPLNEQVEGTVKLDGVPLAQAHVEFVPDTGLETTFPGATASTDDLGHYSLKCNNEKSGAIVGPYRVVVVQGRSEGRQLDDPPPTGKAPAVPPRKSNPTIPSVYGIAAQTPLRVEVTKDKHTYDLQLTRSAVPAK